MSNPIPDEINAMVEKWIECGGNQRREYFEIHKPFIHNMCRNIFIKARQLHGPIQQELMLNQIKELEEQMP